MNTRVCVPHPLSLNDMAYDELVERTQKLENELFRMKKRYQHLFEHAPSGVYEIDFIDRRFISCNEELLLITGYTKEEFMALSPLDLLSEASGVKFLERLQALYTGEEVDEEPEYLVATKDGREFWAKLNPTYIYSKGQLIGAHVVVHDISALKRAEAEIQLTEDKFQHLFQNAQELIAVVQDGAIKIINNNATFMEGYEKNMVMESSFLDFIHPDDRDKAMERYFRRMAGEEIEGTILVRLRMASGDHRWVDVKSVLIDWEGKPATINFMTDVDERITAEKGLKESERKYQIVVNNTQDGIVVLQDGAIKFMNDRTPFLLGYEREEIEFIPFINLIHPDDKERSIERYLKSVNGEDVPSNEILRFYHKNGSICYGEVNNVCIDWEGAPATLTFVLDVTDKVKAEQEANIEKSRSEFYLDLLGHDIGNLMQGISAWIELARRKNCHDEKLKYFLDQSWHLSERSKRLVKNVLIISRIRDKEPKMEAIDLAPMIDRTIEETMDNFPNLEADMEIEMEGCEHRIMAEPLLEEVFYNIIHNAIKFQLDGKPKVRISCRSNTEGRVSIEVSDWGPGIADAHKESIFKRFKDMTGKKSTGIGLALTKELVDRYNGFIMVEDNVEDENVVGSRFIIDLPICE